ncbi:MAG: hypothetical protein KDB69_02040 [Acidimicrobiia bacterium]|nr:hypothetical protein [Acidimicrobiia bacterium]
MDAIWFASPLALLIGAFAIVMIAVRINQANGDLSRAGRSTRRLEDALIPVRLETRRARSSVDHLRRK